jgi:SAM-dependent methyltransferase
VQGDPAAAAVPVGGSGERHEPPWQLELFARSLKKQQKLRLLLEQISVLPGQRRLLITHGDNNGALNYHFRAAGGDWTWMEMEPEGAKPIEELLGERVVIAEASHLPAKDEAFDVVISLDVQEHLDDPDPFNRELARVTRRGGHVVATTPNGSPWKPVSMVRRAIGMTKEKYGHAVYGYDIRQHERMLRRVGLEPVGDGSYSGFFTESIELSINFVYTTVLSRTKTGRGSGEIAPASQDKVRAVEKQLRLYSRIYPVLAAVSRLDALIPFGVGYAVSVVARRPD